MEADAPVSPSAAGAVDVFVARGVRANRGDLASQAGIVYGLRREPSVDNVYVSTHYPHHYSGLSRVVPVRPPPLRGMLLNLPELRLLRSRHPLVFWGGGVDLQDSGSRAKIPLVLLRIAMLRAAGGGPVFQAFQGAGPIRYGASRVFARRIGALFQRSFLREPTAIAELRAAGVGAEKMTHSCDGALLLPSPSADFGADYFRKRGFDPDRPIVGVNLRRWFHQEPGWLPTEFYRRGRDRELPPPMQHLTRNVARAVSRLARDGIRQVALVPMYREQPEFWEDDLFLAEEVKKHLSSEMRTIRVEEDLSPTQLTSILSQLTLMVGVRLHSTILAHVGDVPALHIAYEHKGVEHFEKMGMSECVVDIGDACSAEGERILSERLVEILRVRDALGKRAHERVERLRSEAQRHLCEAVSLATRPGAGS